MRATTRIWRHFDLWLLMAVAMLTIAGIAMIRSAIAGNEELQVTVSRQTMFGAAGLILILLMAAIDYRLWSALARPMYAVTLLLLALIFIAGQAGFGSARWFRVGVLTVQPSELAKITTIIVLADFLSKAKKRGLQVADLGRSLALVGLPAGLILLQPDLSTAVVLIVIWAALVWAAGLKTRYLGILAILGLVAFLITAPLLMNYFLEGYPRGEDFFFLRYYQMQRIATFLFPNPEQRFGATYNVEQALISIGSGGLLGQGYGSGSQVQLRFLKVRHTDFIFSAMAEEFGFVGAVFLLAALIFIIFRCFRAASRARDTFGALICYGVGFLLFFQGAFNIGMNLNLFPVSGLPLPFFSYGGSSLLISLLGVGLVESVILRHKKIEL
jgi:rod shape determining protein RodA